MHANQGITDEEVLDVLPRFEIKVDAQERAEQDVAETDGYSSCQVGLEG